jgi:hypothetical protein
MSGEREEYSVRIRYASGATETAEHLPAETACSIFAEVEDSDRVVAAEVTGPTGTTVDEFDHRA